MPRREPRSSPGRDGGEWSRQGNHVEQRPEGQTDPRLGPDTPLGGLAQEGPWRGCTMRPGHPSAADLPEALATPTWKYPQGPRRKTQMLRKPPPAPSTPASETTQVFVSKVLPRSVLSTLSASLCPGGSELGRGGGLSTGLPSPWMPPSPGALGFSPGTRGCRGVPWGATAGKRCQRPREASAKRPRTPGTGLPSVGWDRNAGDPSPLPCLQGQPAERQFWGPPGPTSGSEIH